MVAISLSQQLTNFIRSLQEQGMLDGNFNHLEDIRNHGNPLFLSQIIGSFLHDSEESIAELNIQLSGPVINYAKVTQAAHLLKGCSSSIGGCRVVLACEDLLRACREADEEKCFLSFERVKHEYDILHNNLNRISEMERAIPAAPNGAGNHQL